MTTTESARNSARPGGGASASAWRPKGRHLTPVLLLVLLAALAGCGGDDPSGPGDPNPIERLAGGGRASDGDPFVGGREDSGPATPGDDPGVPDIAPNYFPVFYSELNCFEEPFARVIDSESEWIAWWDVATSCEVDFAPDPGDGEGDDPPTRLDPDDPPPPPPGDPGDPIDPTDPPEPPIWEPPVIDWDESAVIAIGLETANGWGRSLQIADVVTTGDVTTVSYKVFVPGEDCVEILMGPFDPNTIETSPVIAVVVPRPLGASVGFERSDEVWHCIIEPDPQIPLTLYYSDGECDLGESEAIIRDAARWDAWLAAAVDCDIARWGSGGEPELPDDVRGDDTDPGIPVDPPTGWLSPTVDFTTHAVIILRAPSQTQWGGGVWLNAIESDESGTVIGYSVMAPGSECPPIDGGVTLRPTVAIRVPLPLTEPVTFQKTVETIDCRWEPGPIGDPDDGIGTGSGGSGGTGDGGGPRLQGHVRP